MKRNRLKNLYLASGLAFCVSSCASLAFAGTVVSYTGSTQTWVVPTTGIYQITAAGAQGGASGSNFAGGSGAQLSGFFSLTAGSSISIAIGGQGATGGPAFGGYGGGGGGGTFVYNSTASSLLMVAAGGGGGYSGAVGGAGQAGVGANTGLGGAGSATTGGGGGGFLGAGTSLGTAQGGAGFAGLSGGTTSWAGGANGGFGGGGASGGYGAGGGGGFTGGDASVPGQGGFSKNFGTTPTGNSGVRTGNGYLEYALISTAAAVPTPSAAMGGLLGFAGLAGRSFLRPRRARRNARIA